MRPTHAGCVVVFSLLVCLLQLTPLLVFRSSPDHEEPLLLVTRAADTCEAFLEALQPAEDFFRVATARVLVADYDLLRDHFPDRLATLSDDAIDRWLLAEVAYLSSNHFAHEYREPPKPGERIKEASQAGQFSPYRRRVHTTVQVAEDVWGRKVKRERKVVRPPAYQRAGVFRLGPPPSASFWPFSSPKTKTDWREDWLDVKGIGLMPPDPPISQPSKTGILVVYEALAEYAWARIAQRILEMNGSTMRVLPHYAVIDLGFDFVVYPGSSWLAPATNGTVGAALLVRAAHCREGGRVSMEDSLHLEAIFRRFGLSTCTKYRLPQTCLLNFQGSTDRQMLDLVALKTLQPEQWRWPVVVMPPEGSKVDVDLPVVDFSHHQPDPRLMIQVDDDVWGLEGQGSSREHRRIYKHLLRLHESWKNGSITTMELRQRLFGMMRKLAFM